MAASEQYTTFSLAFARYRLKCVLSTLTRQELRDRIHVLAPNTFITRPFYKQTKTNLVYIIIDVLVPMVPVANSVPEITRMLERY